MLVYSFCFESTGTSPAKLVCNEVVVVVVQCTVTFSVFILSFVMPLYLLFHFVRLMFLLNL